MRTPAEFGWGYSASVQVANETIAVTNRLWGTLMLKGLLLAIAVALIASPAHVSNGHAEALCGLTKLQS